MILKIDDLVFYNLFLCKKRCVCCLNEEKIVKEVKNIKRGIKKERIDRFMIFLDIYMNNFYKIIVFNINKLGRKLCKVLWGFLYL